MCLGDNGICFLPLPQSGKRGIEIREEVRAFCKLLIVHGKVAEADIGSALQKDNVPFTSQHTTAGVLGRYPHVLHWAEMEKQK